MVLITNLIAFSGNWSFLWGLGSRIHGRAQETVNTAKKPVVISLWLLPRSNSWDLILPQGLKKGFSRYLLNPALSIDCNHCCTCLCKSKSLVWGVPVMAQQKWIWLGTLRLWVWSLALLSGLRIWHCHELWYRSQTWLASGVAVA